MLLRSLFCASNYGDLKCLHIAGLANYLRIKRIMPFSAWVTAKQHIAVVYTVLIVGTFRAKYASSKLGPYHLLSLKIIDLITI